MPVPPSETRVTHGGFFSAAGNATASAASCLFRQSRERPGTVLRCFCVAAFDFAARAGGRPLDREKRRALGCLLDFGAAHQRPFRPAPILQAHVPQTPAATNGRRRFAGRLSRILPSGAASRAESAATFGPREPFAGSRRLSRKVVRLSLAALAAIAFGRTEIVDGVLPASLFALVMLIQICDDLLDWRKDLRAGLPTFVTAAVMQDAGQAEENGRPWQAPRQIETVAAAYLSACSKQSGFSPLVPCSYAAFLFVKLLCRIMLRTGVSIFSFPRSAWERGNRRVRACTHASSAEKHFACVQARTLQNESATETIIECNHPGKLKSDLSLRPRFATSKFACRGSIGRFACFS